MYLLDSQWFCLECSHIVSIVYEKETIEFSTIPSSNPFHLNFNSSIFSIKAKTIKLHYSHLQGSSIPPWTLLLLLHHALAHHNSSCMLPVSESNHSTNSLSLTSLDQFTQNHRDNYLMTFSYQKIIEKEWDSSFLPTKTFSKLEFILWSQDSN